MRIMCIKKRVLGVTVEGRELNAEEEYLKLPLGQLHSSVD
jgi:hypothetical protein